MMGWNGIDLFCYCYHILFVLLFTAALSVCFMTCGMTKNRVFLRFGELLFAYILEAIFLAVVEFCAALDLAVSGGPEPLFHVVLEIFSAAEIYLSGSAVCAMFDRQDRGLLCKISLAAFLISLLGLLRGRDVAETISMSMFNVGILVIWVRYRLLRKRDEQRGGGVPGHHGRHGVLCPPGGSGAHPLHVPPAGLA